MPKYYEEDSFKRKRPCDGLREDLTECLINSECMKEGKTAKECLKTECQDLRRSFFECKRSLVDMRGRFREKKGY